MSLAWLRACATSSFVLSLGACVSTDHPGEVVRVATFHGHPEVRFRMAGELRRRDLERGLCGLQIEGPPYLAPRASIVDDQDGDGRQGRLERRIPLRVEAVPGGWRLERESVDSESVALLAHPLLVVEFSQEGRPQVFSRSIE